MGKTVALDANLLVLLVVGLAKPTYISVHKRLKEYETADFNLLRKLLSEAGSVVVTPHALSEASNLLRQIREPARSEIGFAFRNLIKNTTEIFIASAEASSRKEFFRIGLSDSALLEVSKKDIVMLSVDLDLCVAAESAGYQVVNFNHVRGQTAD
jgi:hypothetical protein